MLFDKIQIISMTPQHTSLKKAKSYFEEEMESKYLMFQSESGERGQILKNANNKLNQEFSEVSLDVLNIKGQDYKNKLEDLMLIQTEENRKKIASNYHNFQKLLVNSFRKLNIQEQQEDTHELQRKIWNCFKTSKKMNKCLLRLTFFDLIAEENCQKKNKKIIKTLGFEKILNQYSSQEIRKAQQNLRNILLRKLESIDIFQDLKKRKIKKKINFFFYYQEFMQSLQNGRMNKRFNFKKEKTLENYFNEDSDIENDKEDKEEDIFVQFEVDL